ncbi:MULTISPECIES: hypothetical protein [unclassified Streptomyces]|uniref:hypothetical protein n=1 Tax=unclassified Streptomyces TaxID=2593676 RepID=UPI00236738DC|nr:MULTISPECIES: hypothetical protein [unclassified Streptomyces]MDF3149485.1 hypothetical protein [Streptomyces sp. T21Q-yed]WDF41200.1 hypothetical protein PBV52_32650 [Streptomyces sp. T12]
MTLPTDDTHIRLPEIAPPDHTDHPVLAAILAELRTREGESIVVAHYEDAP